MIRKVKHLRVYVRHIHRRYANNSNQKLNVYNNVQLPSLLFAVIIIYTFTQRKM